jgi:two-component system response regulator FixJ
MTARKPTVFVLDDDTAIQDSLSQLLQVMELPAEFFSTVSEFLAIHDPSRPGLLLLDIRLPGGGLELLKTLSDSDSSLPVIVITGHGDGETRKKALALGAVAFFEKPFDVRQLCECIREVVKSQVS